MVREAKCIVEAATGRWRLLEVTGVRRILEAKREPLKIGEPSVLHGFPVPDWFNDF